MSVTGTFVKDGAVTGTAVAVGRTVATGKGVGVDGATVTALVAVAAGWAGVDGRVAVAVASPHAASNNMATRLKDKTRQVFNIIFFVIEPSGIMPSLGDLFILV
ncbi:MAG: hypothetical protein BGO39_35965 [Chloroflexi bacterium 54-19]|nr:MAG: hypothetical protein BGO39_35965 [Chloroflexi bacterium 54-19]